MANIYTTAMMMAAETGAGKPLPIRHLGLRPTRLLPGIGLCLAVTAVATVLQGIETRVVGEPYLEALVLAILIGVVIRTAWTPGALWAPGIAFSAKILLEVAVVMLGASVSAATVLALGPLLIVGIAFVVAVAIGAELRHLSRPWPAAAHGDPRRLRQFHLW